jgi:hypothetical protein
MIIHSPIISGSLTFANGATFTLPDNGIYSGSFSGSVAGLGDPKTFSASLETKIQQLNIDTGSQDARLDLIETYTSSLETKNSTLATYTASLATTGSNIFVGDQTITGSLAINDSATNFLIEGNGFSQTYLTANGAIVLNPGYGGVEMVGSYRTFKATDITADGFVSGEIRANNGVISGSSQLTATLPTGVVSGSSQVVGILSDLNTFSGSEESKNSTLATYTASLDTKNSTLATYTASLDTKNTTLANVTGSLLSSQTSLNTYTSSLNGALQLTGSTVSFLGNIVVYGTQSIINSENLAIADNLIYLNNESTITNPDLGIVGNYNDGVYQHAGIFRDASDGGTWKVFEGYTSEPSGTIDTTGNGFTLADFKADVITATSFNGVINATNGVISGSSQLTATLPTGVVSGSSQITLSSTTGYGSVINQAVLTSSSPTFAGLTINGAITATGDITAFSASDIRFKENITAIENPIEKIKMISGNTYDWKAENKDIHGFEGNDVGVIAQEIEEVLPQLVVTRDNGYKAVKYDKLVALLIEGIKEQQKQIEDLSNKINKLENEL